MSTRPSIPGSPYKGANANNTNNTTAMNTAGFSTATIPATTPQAKTLKTIGEEAWKRTEKINGELFVMMYGAIVAQLVKDLESCARVNEQLDKMGYNIGVRLIDDFLAKSGWSSRCNDFGETVQVIALTACKMFLNVTPRVVQVVSPTMTVAESDSASSSSSATEYGLIFDENPLTEHVQLPEELKRDGLCYLKLWTGVIRGALEMMQMEVEVGVVADSLRGDERTEFRIRLIRVIEEELPPGE